MHFKRNNFIPFFLFLAWRPSWLEVGITGHNFGSFHKSVIAIGPVVSEEAMLKIGKRG
jgi:hypothetical protein